MNVLGLNICCVEQELRKQRDFLKKMTLFTVAIVTVAPSLNRKMSRVRGLSGVWHVWL